MTFDEWFKQYDWWKENSRYEQLNPVWALMIADGMKSEDVAYVMDVVCSAMRDEYGD